MTNKLLTFFVIGSLISFSTACNKQDTSDNLSSPDVPLKLIGGIKARTTIENNWDTGNSIGIIIFDTQTNNPTLPKNNYQYMATQDGTIGSFSPASAENIAYYPTDGAKVDVMGYYPYTTSIGEGQSVTIHTTDQSDLSCLDFLTSERAYGHSSNNPEVELEFVHRMAKLDITLDALQSETEEELKDASLCISGTNLNATWSLAENKFASKGDIGNISIPIINGKKATAIIIPTTAENELSFTVTTANHTYTANYAYNFEEGTINTLNLHLEDKTVTISATIKAWEEGSGSGDATLENIVTGLSFTGINANGILLLGTQEETTPIKTAYNYEVSTDELTLAMGASPILWDMLEGNTYIFQGVFVPDETVPEGHEKDILIGASESVPFGGSIDMEMTHAMAQFILKLESDGTVDQAELKTATVSFFVPQYVTETDWNRIDAGTEEKRIIIPVSTEDGLTRSATIYPQTWKADDLVISLKLGTDPDGKVYTLHARDITSGKDNGTGGDFTLNAGESYTLSATLTKTAIGIQVTVDNNWKEISGTGTFN